MGMRLSEEEDERGGKVSAANWEAWASLQAILWSRSRVIITLRGGLGALVRECVCVCVCLWAESVSDGWRNIKIIL